MFDMKNLTPLKKLDENAPETMKAFWAFDKEAFKDVPLMSCTSSFSFKVRPYETF